MKIKPLETNRRVLIWLCMFLPDETASKREKLTYIVFTVCGVCTILSMLAASVTFFVKFVSIDLEESLYALVKISAYLCLTYMMIVVFILRHKISDIFEKLSTIYDERELY